jgi:hypothetical protein
VSYRLDVIDIGSRQRAQPAPPRVVFEALTEPDRDPYRRWLKLVDDEQRPNVLRTQALATVVWSSLWTTRPDAVVEFELAPSPDGGTALRWTLYVDEPIPREPLIRHMRGRMNQLINANLRFSFGQ